MALNFRENAAALVGLSGAAVTASVAAVLGVGDVVAAEQAWTLAGSAAVPVAVGLITRGLVWSRERAEQLAARAEVADRYLGPGNTERLVDLARRRGADVVDQAVADVVARVQAQAPSKAKDHEE